MDGEHIVEEAAVRRQICLVHLAQLLVLLAVASEHNFFIYFFTYYMLTLSLKKERTPGHSGDTEQRKLRKLRDQMEFPHIAL